MKILATTAAVLVLGCSLTACEDAHDHRGVKAHGQSSSPTASPSEEAAAAPEPLDYHPSKGDFALKVRVTKQQCFGSAGCNVSYKVSLGWAIPDPGRLDHDYDLTYKVTGGDSGDTIDTITLYKNGKYDVPYEAETGTASANSKLRAKVTRVMRAY